MPREELVYHVARDGFRLALTEWSSDDRSPPRGGPAFLLVHGFAQNRRAFTEGGLPMALAARGARVFLGELRGHGHSNHGAFVSRDWSFHTHLRDDCPTLIEATCQRAGVEGVHLVGHSMGGLLGYALLRSAERLLSLTGMGAPLVLGSGDPVVWLAAWLTRPMTRFMSKAVPIDRFLRFLSGPLSRAEAPLVVRALQRFTRLASPANARSEVLEEVLATADPEAVGVFRDLLQMTLSRRSVLAGVDLAEALKATTIPVAAVVGARDVFAGRKSVSPFEEPGHAGPRKLIEVAGGAHVDVTLGHHIDRVVEELWPFLLGS